MAEFYTQFSCLLDVGSPDNAAQALEIYTAFCAERADEDPASEGFVLSIDPAHGGTTLWLRDEGSGDPEAMIQFVKCCAQTLGLSGLWGFQYANSCSRQRLGAFGGGAHVLDLATGETVGWMDSDGWLAATLAGGSVDA